MVRVSSCRALVAALVVFSLACTSSAQSDTASPQAPPNKSDAQLIDHIAPRRDSSGPPPAKLEWTAAKGADEYAIGLWNESDTLVWRQGGITEPTIPMPTELALEPGTYYWSVVGVKEGRPIAESGLSAFVVLPGER